MLISSGLLSFIEQNEKLKEYKFYLEDVYRFKPHSLSQKEEDIYADDNDDELLKCDYSIIGFSEAFRWIEYHKEKSLEIGYNGFLKGKTEFDYLKQGKLIYEFLAKQI